MSFNAKPLDSIELRSRKLMASGMALPGGSLTPLEDDLTDYLDTFAAGTAEAWATYRLSTLYQTDDTSTPVTIANGTQVCGNVQGITGNIHLTQATAANRPTVDTDVTMVGLKAVDSLDSVFNSTFGTLNQPYTIFVRVKSDSVVNNNENYMIAVANTWSSLAARGIIARSAATSPAGRFAMFAGNVLSSSNAYALSTTRYLTATYNTTSSVGYEDGVSVISGNAGAQTGNTAVGLCGTGAANTHGNDHVIEKAVLVPEVPSAGNLAIVHAWLAEEGDA